MSPSTKSGVLAAAEMLNHLDPQGQERLLRSVEQKDPDLARELREAMFTFADVFALEDGVVQLILREVPVRSLALALRGTSSALLDRVFGQMSSRAAAALKEEIAALGPRPLQEVEAERRKIVEIAKRHRQG